MSTQEVAPADRHHRYEGVFNVRDLGGYLADGGRTVRWGVVYRADGIHRLTGGTLDGLRLRTVIDLRTEEERFEHGQFTATDATIYRHLPVIEKLWDADGLVHDDGDAPTWLAGRYHEMATVGVASIIGTLEALTDDDRLPALFHCAAGKDRTGVVAACLLDLLGVCTDDVCADYALSGPVMAQLRTWTMRERPDYHERMANLPAALMDAPPSAMRLLLDVMRAEHGSVEAYLVDRGAAPDLRERLQESLLEG